MNSFFFRILLFPACFLTQVLLSRLVPGRGDLIAAGIFILLIPAVELTLFREDTALEKPEIPSLFLALAAGFSFSLSLLFLLEAPASKSAVITLLESVSDLCLSENVSPLWILTFFILLPAAEELVFRAGLQNALEQRFSIPVSMIVSTLAFCFFGFARDGAAGAFFCFVTGVLSSLFYVLYENAWVCIFAHAGCSIALSFLYLRYFLSQSALLLAALVSFLSAMALIYQAYRSRNEAAGETEETDES